jgi:hypothetical protein
MGLTLPQLCQNDMAPYVRIGNLRYFRLNPVEVEPAAFRLCLRNRISSNEELGVMASELGPIFKKFKFSKIFVCGNPGSLRGASFTKFKCRGVGRAFPNFWPYSSLLRPDPRTGVQLTPADMTGFSSIPFQVPLALGDKSARVATHACRQLVGCFKSELP